MAQAWLSHFESSIPAALKLPKNTVVVGFVLTPGMALEENEFSRKKEGASRPWWGAYPALH